MNFTVGLEIMLDVQCVVMILRDSSNNVTNNIDLILIFHHNLSNQRQFDICYNIFGDNQQPIPQPSPSEALSYLTNRINNSNK